MADETPSQSISTGLWDRVLAFFDGMWERFWKTNPDLTNPFLGMLADELAKKFDQYGVSYLKDNLQHAIDDLDIPQEVKDTIAKVTTNKDFSSLLMAYLVVIVYYAGYITKHAAVAGELASHKWNAAYTPLLPDIQTLLITMYRNPDLQNTIKDRLHEHGFSDDNISLLLKGSRSILDPNQIRLLFLRKEIDEATHDDLLKCYGYNEDEIIEIRKLYYPIPSYPDLINMAVREAFQPDYIQEFDLLKEYPAEFQEWAQKQGLSEDWCKKFWASHWALPSILQGFEMLHRNVITAEELDSLFMATDIMPWWREKLKAISYNPLTRVDVRRVFKMGIVSRDQVKRTYLDLGYDDEKAEWLTKFTVMESLEKERDLTKAEVLDAYTKKIITKESCGSLLTNLGYSESEIDVLIAGKDYSDYKTWKALELKRIKKMYLAGVYDRPKAVSELGKLDLPGSEQTAVINEWDAEKLSKLRSLTKKEYDSLYQNKIITRSEYITEMKQLGYITKDIDRVLELLDKTTEE